MRGEYHSYPLAILQLDAGHRHQKLHRHVRGDFALSHLLLDRLRQQFHQRQPPRHPTHAAVEPPRQLLQPVSEALLLQQPALLQCALLLRHPEGTVQQEGIGFLHRPDHRFHGVAAQLLERRNTLVAIDHQVPASLAGSGHHHDRRLLSRLGQRGQQPSLPLGMADSQMFPAPIELVKLQLHSGCRRVSVWGSLDLVFSGGRAKCTGNSRAIN